MTSMLMFSMLRGMALLSIGQTGGATPQPGSTAVPPAMAAPVSVPIAAPRGAQPTALTAAQGANVAADAVRVNSIWDFVLKGGPVMIPIGVCSMIAFTVVVERLLSLRRRRVIPPGFTTGLRSILRSGGDSNDAALTYCREQGGELSEIFAAALRYWREPYDVLERHVQRAGEHVVFQLQRNLRILSVIATIATMLGLLGTTLGMITTFQTVATSAQALGRTEMLAKGIYEKLITTAAGLCVAIPTLAAYHAFSAKVDRLVHEMDYIVMDFIEGLRGTHPHASGSETTRARTSIVSDRVGGDGRFDAATSSLTPATAEVRIAG